MPFTLKVSATGEVADAQFFDVQPNPFRSETTFRVSLPQAVEVELTVSNLGGQTVSTRRISANAGLNSFLWKTSTELPPGVYFARLATETGSLVR